MENITIGAVQSFVINLSSFIIAGGTIGVFALKLGKGILDKQLKPFKDKITDLEEARIEQNNKVDEVEKERFYEVYRDYKELGGNSYIQHKVEKLQKEGKL